MGELVHVVERNVHHMSYKLDKPLMNKLIVNRNRLSIIIMTLELYQKFEKLIETKIEYNQET